MSSLGPHRVPFLQVERVWLFYALAALASIIFLAGVAAHLWMWKKHASHLRASLSKEALKRTLLDTFLGRRVIKGDLGAGIMHLLIFWGFLVLFLGTCFLAFHHYLFSFLEGDSYLIFSFVMEIAGVMLLAGVVWSIIRRYIQRIPRLERKWEDALVPGWLFLVALSGFMLEGLRMRCQQPPWEAWSFAGAWIAALFSFPACQTLYPYFWWGHVLLSLCLIAAIPFTKMFHILSAPTAIYLQNSSGLASLKVEEEEEGFPLADLVFFDACMRCGRCVEACPSTGAGEPFKPRDFIQGARHALWYEHFPLGDIRLQSRNNKGEVDDKIWYCTTCRACLEVCPVYGAIFKAVMEKRVLVVEDGTRVPAILNQTLEKIFNYDNPWVSSKRNRGAWAKELDLAHLAKNDKNRSLCYFVGCTTSFDARAKRIALSFSTILQVAGVEFGILGNKEACCGEIARCVGETGLFVEKMARCLELFERYEIREVVTSSPHCFHTFRNEYPQAPFAARHYTLFLRELIARDMLQFERAGEVTVTYHDPCYLGRYNQIFDEPREIINSIPGLRLVEMTHHKANSLCCGGGGGRMWQELDGETKMSQVRIREAEETGAQILITACPLCLIMLEDARKALGLTETLQVMDLNEVVLEALKTGEY